MPPGMSDTEDEAQEQEELAMCEVEREVLYEYDDQFLVVRNCVGCSLMMGMRLRTMLGEGTNGRPPLLVSWHT